MMIPIQNWKTAVRSSLVLALLGLSACVVGAGYDGDVGVGVGGYYEPYGVEYGGWGSGYRVGPGRGGEHRSGGGNHSYRAASPSRSAPSIPSRSRGR